MKILKKINIKFNNTHVIADLYDTPTGQAITDKLTIESKVNTWGKEIYFSIPVICDLEKDSRSDLEIGELGYYPPMQAFCIFFGTTPMSSDGKPRAADDVNVFGRITSSVEGLNQIISGETVNITEI